ncbi:MAG: GNAT family N-acetyltransferase [Pyrinomonadaceae bacterium]|nr:GNAT family N-acetyltransferase [Pyrinomonadaceae bacterium]
MQIRIAIGSDVATLFRIRTSVKENYQSQEELAAIGVTPESVGEMLRTTARVWVAEIDDEGVAFSMADAEQGTIFAMFVRPGYEHRGAGRALMRAAEEWLFSQGHDEIWLLTGSDERLRANGFYRHLGWNAEGIEADGQLRYVKRKHSSGDVK